jgi:hypothetical protein
VRKTPYWFPPAKSKATSAAARAAQTVRFRPLVAEDELKARHLGERPERWWVRLGKRFMEYRRMFD